MKTLNLWTGRAPFPVRALCLCEPRDDTDEAVIVRSIRLGDKFHGVVELDGMTRPAMDLLQRAGWKRYVPNPRVISSYVRKG